MFAGLIPGTQLFSVFCPYRLSEITLLVLLVLASNSPGGQAKDIDTFWLPYYPLLVLFCFVLLFIIPLPGSRIVQQFGHVQYFQDYLLCPEKHTFILVQQVGVAASVTEQVVPLI